ncbi:MAG: hypothetical protein A4E64_00083 [Syntrophorhabdus sp. PtaU1.Bin058]|nr:MAG: hypothetical protein A4E64_00083 [Syntrophorhabdus sp. PtaU1.Bin058]
MKQGSRNKGVALVIVMAIITISSALIAVIVYFVMKGTEYTALNKRYQTSREASLGGIEFFTKELIPLTINGTNLSNAVTTFNNITAAKVNSVASDVCFLAKLRSATTSWPTGCDSTLDAKTSADIKLTLSGTGGAQPFDVYTKIVDTVVGNTNISGVVLEGMGTAESASGVITSQHFPYMYTIMFQGERQNNPAERAEFEVLYAY